MHAYTLPDLQNRYGMRKSALHKFLVRHLGEINHNGQHALKTQNRWVFDDFAVSVLDRLRNLGQVTLDDSQTVQELNDTIANLQQQLIAAQNLNNRHQETISTLQQQLIAELKEKAEIKDKLASASFELLRIQANDKDTEKIQKENQRLQDNLTAEKKKSTQLDNQIAEMNLQVKALENENSILKKESKKSNMSSGWNRRFSPHYIKLVNVKRIPISRDSLASLHKVVFHSSLSSTVLPIKCAIIFLIFPKEASLSALFAFKKSLFIFASRYCI